MKFAPVSIQYETHKLPVFYAKSGTKNVEMELRALAKSNLWRQAIDCYLRSKPTARYDLNVVQLLWHSCRRHWLSAVRILAHFSERLRPREHSTFISGLPMHYYEKTLLMIPQESWDTQIKVMQLACQDSSTHCLPIRPVIRVIQSERTTHSQAVNMLSRTVLFAPIIPSTDKESLDLSVAVDVLSQLRALSENARNHKILFDLRPALKQILTDRCDEIIQHGGESIPVLFERYTLLLFRMIQPSNASTPRGFEEIAEESDPGGGEAIWTEALLLLTKLDLGTTPSYKLLIPTMDHMVLVWAILVRERQHRRAGRILELIHEEFSSMIHVKNQPVRSSGPGKYPTTASESFRAFAYLRRYTKRLVSSLLPAGMLHWEAAFHVMQIPVPRDSELGHSSISSNRQRGSVSLTLNSEDTFVVFAAMRHLLVHPHQWRLGAHILVHSIRLPYNVQARGSYVRLLNLLLTRMFSLTPNVSSSLYPTECSPRPSWERAIQLHTSLRKLDQNVYMYTCPAVIAFYSSVRAWRSTLSYFTSYQNFLRSRRLLVLNKKTGMGEERFYWAVTTPFHIVLAQVVGSFTGSDQWRVAFEVLLRHKKEMNHRSVTEAQLQILTAVAHVDDASRTALWSKLLLLHAQLPSSKILRFPNLVGAAHSTVTTMGTEAQKHTHSHHHQQLAARLCIT